MKNRNRGSTFVVLLALPVFVIVGLTRLIRALWSCRYAWARVIPCRYCRHAIPLVRPWRCACGFTYVGSVLRLCPVCRTRPIMVRCHACGMTRTIR